MKASTIIKLILLVCAIFAFITIWPFAQVPAGSRGVVTTFGKPNQTVYGEGIHLILPIAQKMNQVYVAIITSQDEGEAASKDLQTVHTTITLNYHVDPDAAVSVFVNLGNDPEARIVQPSVQEAVKAITAKFTAEELITRREEVRNQIIADLTARMQRHGLMIDEFSITNFKFSEKFNEAIEGKTTAEQLKLKAMRDLERIKVEAEQAQAQAKGEADALAMKRQQITPDLLALRSLENQAAAIDKWDGVMPTMVMGDKLPLITVTPPIKE